MMSKVYRVLAYLVAAGVVFQVAVIAYGFFGMGGFVDGGGTLDKATLESGHYAGAGGFDAHGTGAMIVSVIVLLFLISSFFAKVPGGIKWALIVFGITVFQWAFAFLAFAVASLGFLHGINALALFGCAIMAGMRVPRALSARGGAMTTTEAVGEPARPMAG